VAGDARPAELLDRRHAPAAASHGSSTLDATATTASSDPLRDEGGQTPPSAVFTCIGALGTPSRTAPLARKQWRRQDFVTGGE